MRGGRSKADRGSALNVSPRQENGANITVFFTLKMGRRRVSLVQNLKVNNLGNSRELSELKFVLWSRVSVSFFWFDSSCLCKQRLVDTMIHMASIKFYDLVPRSGGAFFSPNTMKTRLCLLQKRVGFTTVEVTYKDLRTTWTQRLGWKATGEFL